VTLPDRTSVPERPDLATLSGRHAKSWNGQPQNWLPSKPQVNGNIEWVG